MFLYLFHDAPFYFLIWITPRVSGHCHRISREAPRLLCAQCTEPAEPPSFTFPSTRPAIAGLLCLHSRFKTNAIVLLFVLIFFEHLTIVSVSRKMVDVRLGVSDHGAFALCEVLSGPLPFRLFGPLLFSLLARYLTRAKCQRNN